MTQDNQARAGANTGLWTGPRLLVPMTVEALVVAESDQNGEWSIAPMIYQFNGTEPNFAPIEPGPFSVGAGLQYPPWGVTLHWALPDALTQGRQQNSSPPAFSVASPPSVGGGIDFPLVPNRWLIIRSSLNPALGSPPTVPRTVKAWVLESDYLGTDGTNQFLQPGNTQVVTNIGKVYDFENWSGDTSQPPPLFLQATGPGDATFASYTANIFNVFSFQDSLSDLTGSPPNSLTTPLLINYLVVGWYSDPTADPLYNGTDEATWLQLMKELNWSLDNIPDEVLSPPSELPSELPRQILCHGNVYNVKWYGPGADAPSQSGVPHVNLNSPPTFPLISIGNSGIDALAALIEYQITNGSPPGAEVARVLEAFQYNLLPTLDESDGEAKLDQQIHQAWFGSVPGGINWEVVKPAPLASPPSPGDQSPPAFDVNPVSLTTAESALLAQLNEAQRELDRLNRVLPSLQFELYALWWKNGYCNQAGNPFSPIDPACNTLPSTAPLISEIQSYQTALIPVAEKQRDTFRDQLAAMLPLTLQLVNNPLPRFWQPNDPVVLIYNVGRSYKHGEDGRFSDNDTLFCRMTGQTIASITVPPVASPPVLMATVTPSNLVTPLPALPNLGVVPPEVLPLFNESFFLDTSNADEIALTALTLLKEATDSAAVRQLANTVQQQQTLIWNKDYQPGQPLDPPTVAELSGLNGTIPSLVAVSLWQPPWSPLFMDWSIDWYPATDQPASPPSSVLDTNWQFDGLDWNWIDGSVQQSSTVDPGIMGRTFITPQTSESLRARLEKFLHDNTLAQEAGQTGAGVPVSSQPDWMPEALSALGEFINVVGNWDLLSQSMSGFQQYLIMRDPGQHLLPDQSISAEVGSGTSALPAIAANFYPIRAGHFILKKLWIVDDFGQVFDVIKSSPNPDSYQPIISRWLQTPASISGYQQKVQLPPRVIQPSRLSFRFYSAEGQDESNSVAETSPVCGWLLPNHLDQGVMVYDADGNALGELILVGGSENQRVRWDPVPDTPTAVGAPVDIQNENLKAFVEGLLNQPQGGGQAFIDLMAVIDATLWTVDPLGGRSNQSLSVLVGQPLAVVRAKLTFELDSAPVYDQSLADTGQQVTAGFTEVNFPIILGNLKLRDDGLLGYFLEPDFNQFNSVHNPNDLVSPPQSPPPGQPYVVWQNENSLRLQLNSDLTSPPGQQSHAYVTMILDPRGSVHASTGIHPTKSLTLPSYYVVNALNQMEVTFRTGPLLSDPETLRMPLPAEQPGTWAWLQRANVTTWQPPDAKIVKADPSARLSTTPQLIREGWLKLSGALGTDKKK